MTEETVTTEQEVRNQRAMINDTIAIGWHVRWTLLSRRLIKDDIFS